MATVKDISITDDGLQFKNGDILVELSDNMHIQHLLEANKGQYYQYPLIGAGMRNFIKSPMSALILKKEIRINLESDNMTVNRVSIIQSTDDFLVDIDAERKI